MAEMEGRDGRRPGTFWIDNELVTVHAKKIGVHAFAVYMVLVEHSRDNECFPSTSTIADELAISRQTVSKAIHVLEAEGLIHIEGRALPVRGQTSHLYTILQVAKTAVNVVDTPCQPRLQLNNTKVNNTKLRSGGVVKESSSLSAEYDAAAASSSPDVLPIPGDYRISLPADVEMRLQALSYTGNQLTTIAAAAAAARGGFSLSDVELCERWIDAQRKDWSGKYGGLYTVLKAGKLPVLPRSTATAVQPQPTLTMEEFKRKDAAMRAANPEFEALLADLKAEEAKYARV